ncbi:uncharacterized protein LOC131239151 [Magnolia sinica]|uniref:uncharacterized protein LOC131239151 n=1 Tax=Magnolia sinica TaxID=86752 RepID=UPI002658E832|nr:uncharacterized protein LOC131239151 [Magnolia sinica]
MDVVMPRDRSTGAYRGFVLVRMSSEMELARAVDMLHGVKFAGCPLLVQRARFGPNLTPPPKPLQTNTKMYRPKSDNIPTLPSPIPTNPDPNPISLGPASFKEALLNNTSPPPHSIPPMSESMAIPAIKSDSPSLRKAFLFRSI